MIDAGGAIPGGVEVILHVGVIGEEFAVVIDAAVEDVAEAGGEDFHVLALGIEAINDAARGHDVAVVAATIGHAWEEVVIPPKLGHRGAVRGALVRAVFEHGVVAGDEVQTFAIGRLQNGVHAVIAAAVEFTQHFYLVRHVIAIAVGDAVQATRDLFLVIVDSEIKRAIREQHAVHRTDVSGHFLHVCRLQRLTRGGSVEAVETAVLIAGIDAAFVVGAEVHPRALIAAGHRIQQLHFEIRQCLDVADRRGHIRADGRSNGLGAGGFGFGIGGSFGFGFAFALGLLGGQSMGEGQC